MGASVSSLGSSTGLTSFSTAAADQKRDMLNKIFKGLYQNANEIDMNALTDPKLCSSYVFKLQSAIKDARDAEKAGKLKFLLVDSGGQLDRVAFHPTRRKMQTEAELCREMAVFYLQLIFFLYVSSFTSNRDNRDYFARPYARSHTRKHRQRGGAQPIVGLEAFVSNKYEHPSPRSLAEPENADYFYQLYPRIITGGVPEVLFQKHATNSGKVYFFVLLTNPKKHVRFSVQFAEGQHTSFEMIIYRCRVSRECNIPVLKGMASITGSERDLKFSLNTNISVLKNIYQINDLNESLSMDDLVRILRVAARANEDQLLGNSRYILSNGQQAQRITPLTGIESVASGLEESKGAGFAKMASEFKQLMVKNNPNLYQIRKNMLTEAGNHIQSWSSSFSTETLRRVIQTFSKGASNFSVGGGSVSEKLVSSYSQWDNLREGNERRYKSLDRDRREVLVPSRIGQLKVFRDRLDNAHNKYTMDIARIIERNVIKSVGSSFIINPDFFNPDRVPLTSLKKLNLITDDAGEVILRYFIELEMITQEAFNTVFSYIR
jgi:hypothetical protein